MVSNKEKMLRINRRYFMATSVKNLNKKNGRMAVEVIDAPYKEELVITSVKNGNARIEGTATLQVMAYIIELGGLLDKSSNFAETIGVTDVTAIETKINGTYVKISAGETAGEIYNRWKRTREADYKALCKSTEN